MGIIKEYLSNEIKKSDTVLDIGCGIKTYSIYGITTTVDAWEKLQPDYLIDLEKNKLPFVENSFDYILIIDFIEHIDKNIGLLLLEDCKKIVRKKIIIFTPLIFDDNSINVNNKDLWCYGNTYDYHKSLWSDIELNDFITIHKDNGSYFGYWEKIN